MKKIAGVEMYTTGEAAKILGVSQPTVRRMIQMKQVKALKMANSYFLSKKEIENYVGVALD